MKIRRIPTSDILTEGLSSGVISSEAWDEVKDTPFDTRSQMGSAVQLGELFGGGFIDTLDIVQLAGIDADHIVEVMDRFSVDFDIERGELILAEEEEA